jgi:GNAT superfamily N-acetyltransferase
LTSAGIAHELEADEKRLLAESLADAPENCIEVHFLRRNLCRAWVAGDPHSPVASLIQPRVFPDELTANGTGAADVWQLLQVIENWASVEVESRLADELAGLIERRTGLAVRTYDDVYFVGRLPVVTLPHPYVRLLGPFDRHLVDALPESRAGDCWGGSDVLLREGFAAGAVVSGRLVAVAFTSARTDRYADIGAFTVPGWRRRGMASLAAAHVAGAVQNRGLTPIWSCGADNLPSTRLARRLGFAEHARLSYIIPVRG